MCQIMLQIQVMGWVPALFGSMMGSFKETIFMVGLQFGIFPKVMGRVDPIIRIFKRAICSMGATMRTFITTMATCYLLFGI